MSVLAVFLSGRDARQAAATPAGLAPSPETNAEGAELPRARSWAYVYSADGRTVTEEGQTLPSMMPRAARVVLVAAEEDVSWHRCTLPKTPASRLREVLAGLLEEELLSDPAELHLALQEATSAADRSAWVAALDKARLQSEMATLMEAGLEADALVCLAEPGPVWRLHARHDRDDRPVWVWSGPEGQAVLPMGLPGLASRLPAAGEADILWSAEPAAAAEAQAARHQLQPQHEADIPVQTRAERVMAAVAEGHNLLQFDLAPRLKGSRAVDQALRQFGSHRLRWVRRGLVSLLLVQVLGLNALAWQQGQASAQIESAMRDLLQGTFPSVQVVLDAPLQMQRELAALRQASGQPDRGDLETALDLITAAWPAHRGPAASMTFDDAGIHLDLPDWTAPDIEQMSLRARAAGWELRQEGSRASLLKPKASP